MTAARSRQSRIPGLLARAVALVIVLLSGALTAAPQQPNTDALYQEARRLFDALDYERAVVSLDQVIAGLQGTPAEPVRNDRLASAYEMRARSKFGLGDQDGAKADFTMLLKLAPAHALSGQVSPRIVALFEETARDTVTNLTVSLTPATAKLQLDGVAIQGPGTIRVAVGEHVVSAEQPGYRAMKETITAVAGAPGEVTLALERISSVIRITTVPPDVEVKVDGVVVGKTAAAADAAGAQTASAPLVISDVASGTHSVALARPCFVSATQRVEVERPDDYSVGPVTLLPAVAGLSITANQPNAQVFVDGKDRGVAPLKLADLCEGEHLVELRTRFGSDSRRVTIRAGNDVTIEGVLKPAFAVVSVSGATAASQQDLRVIVERAFAASRTVTLIAPPAEDAAKALSANQLSPEWLAIDLAGRPIGAAAQLAAPLRKESSSKLADAFRTQGVASVTMIGPTRAVIALLGAGSGAPDVLDVALDNPASIAAAISRLDRSISLTRTSLGLQVIDVADLAGVVIVGIDGSSGSADSTARVGDVIVQADGKPVTDAAALARLAADRKPGDAVSLDVRDASGAARRIDLKVLPTPRLIGLSEQGLLSNRILLDLRSRLADATDPFEQSVIRLNMAVALARVGDWSAAREELQRVKLTDQPGVGNGTVQYLLGLASESLGNRAEAEAAFKAAAGSESLLTEEGPSVKELAEAKLVEMQKPAR
jgi:hypothetical protein